MEIQDQQIANYLASEITLRLKKILTDVQSHLVGFGTWEVANASCAIRNVIDFIKLPTHTRMHWFLPYNVRVPKSSSKAEEKLLFGKTNGQDYSHF